MKSKAIMLNKYGLNVGAAYVEQSTLLEPNNFIPSWEAGDEEKKEVSNALRVLRQRYDVIHRQVMEKERALEQLHVSAPSPNSADRCSQNHCVVQRLGVSPFFIKNNSSRFAFSCSPRISSRCSERRRQG